MKFRDELIARRLENLKAGKELDRFDLLQGFIEARDDDGKPLSIEQIKSDLLLVMIAGADPVGTGFQALVLSILRHPAVRAKLLAELDAATRAGHLSPGVPQHDEVMAHCPYYVACVRETMRLTPPAPNFFPRLAPDAGLELFPGQFVPGGTELTGNPWITNRDPAVYGEDADEFRPERWLDDDAAKMFLKYNLTFGYGPRVCMGKELAQMELFKAPLMFFRDFNPTLINEEPPQVSHGGVSHFEDMWITIEKRVCKV